MPSVLRPRLACAKIGVGRSNFHENFVLREGGPAHLPGTTIPRLKPIILGPRARGFIDDEVDALIEALCTWRDSAAAHPDTSDAQDVEPAFRRAVTPEDKGVM